MRDREVFCKQTAIISKQHATLLEANKDNIEHVFYAYFYQTVVSSEFFAKYVALLCSL